MSDLPKDLDWNRDALFLDFDGTLTPIVDTPDAVVVGSTVQDALLRLQVLTNGALAIISGRALADLEQYLGDLDCAMSGSHGLELQLPGSERKTVADLGGSLGQAFARLSSFAIRHGLLVEDKPGAVTLHYRSKPDLGEVCQSFVEEVAGSDPGLRAMHGNMVSEVALNGINKGTALARLMAEPPFRNRLPVMAGDDVTDEDAFRAAQAQGGFGIKIGPGPTSAIHRVADIDDFLAWLCEAAGLPPK